MVECSAGQCWVSRRRRAAASLWKGRREEKQNRNVTGAQGLIAEGSQRRALSINSLSVALILLLSDTHVAQRAGSKLWGTAEAAGRGKQSTCGHERPASPVGRARLTTPQTRGALLRVQTLLSCNLCCMLHGFVGPPSPDPRALLQALHPGPTPPSRSRFLNHAATRQPQQLEASPRPCLADECSNNPGAKILVQTQLYSRLLALQTFVFNSLVHTSLGGGRTAVGRGRGSSRGSSSVRRMRDQRHPARGCLILQQQGRCQQQ